MLRVDAAYFYGLGKQLKRIDSQAAEDTSRFDLMIGLLGAKKALSGFIYQSVFDSSLRTLIAPAQALLARVEELSPDFADGIDYAEVIPGWRISSVKEEFAKFEAVLLAILQSIDLYYVSPKGGFDTASLTGGGVALFPASLGVKVPEALADIQAAARCLAFELPTAAGFHFHRANEAVLRRYFDQLAGADARPTSGNMGEYLKILSERKLGEAKVIHALRSIKDLHRNPLMHPDEALESVEEAISLYAAIRASIGYMLDRIDQAAAEEPASLPFDPPLEMSSVKVVPPGSLA